MNEKTLNNLCHSMTLIKHAKSELSRLLTDFEGKDFDTTKLKPVLLLVQQLIQEAIQTEDARIENEDDTPPWDPA